MENKKEIEDWRKYMGIAKQKGDMLWKYHEGVKTHQAPRCKVYNKPKPRLDQETMIYNNCNKYKDLEEWY